MLRMIKTCLNKSTFSYWEWISFAFGPPNFGIIPIAHNIWFKFWHNKGGILVAARHVNRFRCFWLVPGVPQTLRRHANKEKGNSLLTMLQEKLWRAPLIAISLHILQSWLICKQPKQPTSSKRFKKAQKKMISRDINRVKLDYLLANVFDAVVKGLQQLKILR